VLAALIIGVTIASKWWSVTCTWYIENSGSRAIEVGGGTVEFKRYTLQVGLQSGWRLERCYAWEWGWGDRTTRAGQRSWYCGFEYVAVSHWTVYGMSLIYPALLCGGLLMGFWLREWRERCRTGANACSACGYDLSGLSKGAPCPECGEK